jgi:histone-lysine N-methyltransferase SETMAR
MKITFITFFDINGIVHFELIPQVQTVNQAYHVEIVKQEYVAVRRKRPELWPNDWILHDDNAPAHKALSVKQFMAQKSITEMEHPPYSPDLAPNDFWLLPKLVFKNKV